MSGVNSAVVAELRMAPEDRTGQVSEFGRYEAGRESLASGSRPFERYESGRKPLGIIEPVTLTLMLLNVFSVHLPAISATLRRIHALTYLSVFFCALLVEGATASARRGPRKISVPVDGSQAILAPLHALT